MIRMKQRHRSQECKILFIVVQITNVTAMVLCGAELCVLKVTLCIDVDSLNCTASSIYSPATLFFGRISADTAFFFFFFLADAKQIIEEIKP